jgi:AAA domain
MPKEQPLIRPGVERDFTHDNGTHLARYARNFAGGRRVMTKRQTKKLYTSMLVPHTGKDLQKAPLVKTAWLVDGMIPSTGVTFLHGPTTAGKSALTWAIGNAVQTGKPLFGLQTVKTEVLFVSLDMAKDPLKMRWFGTKDKPKAPSSRFNPEFTTIFPKLFPFIEENGDGDAFRAAFKSFIELYGLIVIDALGRFVGDTISGTDATLCYKYLSQVLGEKACILIHHDGKNRGKTHKGKSSSDDYSGTKRWIDFAQHQLHLTQDSSTDGMRILQQGEISARARSG